MIYRLEMRPHQSFAEAEVLGDGDYLVQAVEQVAEAGPLQGRSRVERVEAGGEGVVALLQHGLQQREGLTQIPLRVVVQLGQAVVHPLWQYLLQEATCLSHTLRQLAGLLHNRFGTG